MSFKSYLYCLTLLVFLCRIGNSQELDSLNYLQFFQKHINSTYYGDSVDVNSKLAGLSRAWAEAKWNFVNFDQNPGLNWDSLFHAYIPKVLASESITEYYQVLTSFYTYLNDGHSMIIAPFSLWDSLYASLPIKAELVEDKVVISENLSPTLPEYSILKPGSIIHKVNGMEIHSYIDKNIAPYISYTSSADSISRIFSHLFTRGNIRKPIELEFQQVDGNHASAFFTRLPQHEITTLSKEKPIKFSQRQEGIGLLSLPGFSQHNQTLLFDSIFRVGDPGKALIIDLRDNNSGLLYNVYDLLGYFHETTFSPEKILNLRYYPARRARQQMPYETEIYSSIRQPYWADYFEGPVVILINRHTHGIAEIFIASLQNRQNITLIGENTAGGSGNSMFFRLPGEGMGFVSTQRNLTDGKEEYYRVGFHPDIQVKNILSHLLNGEDIVMRTALEYLEKKLAD